MKLKKMLAAVLTMAMVATALPVTVFADASIDTMEEVQAALANGDTTINIDQNIQIGNGTTPGGEFTLTLNNQTIQFANGKGFVVANGGSLTIEGSGKITEVVDGKGDFAPIRVFGGGTVDVSGVTLEGWAGIMVREEAKEGMNGCGNDDIRITVKDAELIGVSDTGDGTGVGLFVNGSITGAIIKLEDTTVTANGVGILQSGKATTTITDCEITGAEAGVEVRDGSLDVYEDDDQTVIKSTASTYSLTANGSGSTTVGAGLAVVSHDGRTPEATVYGGTISGVVGVVASASDSRVKDEPNQTKEGEATVTLSGGTIDADEYGVRVLDGSKVTLAGADVKSDFWGVYVRGLSNNAQATTFNVTGGSITAVGAPAISGSGNENAYDNTVINISGDAEITSTNDVAIYQPQNGVLNISGEAEITGTSGVHAKDGTVNVSGDAVITGTAMGETYNPDAVADGAQGTGAAILLESNTASYGTPVANISGGTMNSSSSAVDAVEAQKAAGETNAVAAAVSGGTFSTPVAPEMLTTGAAVIENGGEYSYYPNVNAAKDAAQEIADETGTNVSVYEAEDLNADGTVKEDAQGETVQPTPAPTPSTPKKSTKKYSVSVDTDEIENGSIKLSSSKVKKGATVTLTVTPDAGYELDKLVVLDKDGDVVELTDKGDGKFTFKMPRGGVEVDASFVEADAVVVKDTAKIVLTIDSIVALVNGEPVVNDVAPIIKGERTFLPIRLIAEELGATVTWNEAEQSVTIVKDDMGIVIYIGQAFALVNGEPVQLDAPAFIQNDRTYLPVRFISENLGAVVTWDDTAKTVTIVG